MFLEIKQLLYKEFLIEWRQKYALNGILLYLISSVFVAYLAFSSGAASISPTTWNALFWIILLFATVNGVAKSFLQENENRQIYFYSIASPQAIIFSKTIYNFLLSLILAGLGLIIYSIFMGSFILNYGLFISSVILSSFGFSASLTLISAIASKANAGATLMAILSFPVILPIILMAIKISRLAIQGLDFSSAYNEILVLGAINLLILSFSFLLFPYLWRS